MFVFELKSPMCLTAFAFSFLLFFLTFSTFFPLSISGLSLTFSYTLFLYVSLLFSLTPCLSPFSLTPRLSPFLSLPVSLFFSYSSPLSFSLTPCLSLFLELPTSLLFSYSPPLSFSLSLCFSIFSTSLLSLLSSMSNSILIKMMSR